LSTRSRRWCATSLRWGSSSDCDWRAASNTRASLNISVRLCPLRRAGCAPGAGRRGRRERRVARAMLGSIALGRTRGSGRGRRGGWAARCDGGPTRSPKRVTAACGPAPHAASGRRGPAPLLGEELVGRRGDDGGIEPAVECL
jgi:hypothetical protein